uniref:Uncharacterized protein n=1 Tax=Uncultured archaeon GZfos26G2 TaxID=3386331 RepID=Q649G5_UNCAG|nr:hypothetical protein GZ35A2_37 [uncultured archaeon GZfos35A2]
MELHLLWHGPDELFCGKIPWPHSVIFLLCIKYNCYLFNLGRRFTRIYTDLIFSVLICVNPCQ